MLEPLSVILLAAIALLLTLTFVLKLREGYIIMAIGQDILTAVQAQLAASVALSNAAGQLSTSVNNLVAAVDTLLGAGSITPDVASQILGTLTSDKAATDAANTAVLAAGQAVSDELAKLNPPPAPAGPVAPAV